MAKNSNDGCGATIGWFAIFVVIAAIHKPVWITIGVVVAVALVVWVVKKVVEEAEKSRAEAAERERVAQQARAAAEKRERQEAARRRKQYLIDTVGTVNATYVERAEGAARAIAATESARAGWLGDVDFQPDITAITSQFQRAHELLQVAGQLSVLDNPNADDRKLLAEAKTTVATLEAAAFERIELITKCEREAENIDNSLRQEREDARTAEQRAELQAKLSAMLYGIEATPGVSPTSQAADSVMARVQAYREIKGAIQQIRDSGTTT